MFECDVKLSADDILFLLHDATLERTSNGRGDARAMDWTALSKLDAGSWHSAAFAGEPLAGFEAIARYCLDNDFFLNIEIKPTPDLEVQTGTAVAHAVARLWPAGKTPPLLTSFQPTSRAAARDAQPQLPRGLLLDTLPPGWLDTARGLGCVAVVCNYRLWNPGTLAQAREAGLKTLCYTANEPDAVARLLALGVDGIITDRVDIFPTDRRS